MDRLRILVVHNRYRQYGGEDSVVDAEIGILREAGHEVDTFIIGNDNIEGLPAKVAAASLTVYNPFSRRRLAERLRADPPDIVHVHNFFPQLSPSIFDACARQGVPVAMTMHNFRVRCSNGFFFRDGKPCEDCLHGTAYQAVLHRCYRASRLGSLTLASMIEYHGLVGTWRRKVSRFIALTEFSRSKLIAAGVPAEKLVVKPNFVPDPLPAVSAQPRPGHSAVFVGRLSVEKGVSTLIDAWHGLGVPLRIVGDGPEGEALRRRAPENVTFLGHRGRDEVFAEIAAASFMVVPSIWYENFPVTVVEAMALGKPIVASAIGALQEIVTDGKEGLHFRAGDPGDLRRVVEELLRDPGMLEEMGRGARRRYLERLTPSRNLEMLAGIYRGMLDERIAAAG